MADSDTTKANLMIELMRRVDKIEQGDCTPACLKELGLLALRLSAMNAGIPFHQPEPCDTMLACNSIESNFGQVAILIGSQRNSFPAVAHCLSDPFFRGATVKQLSLIQDSRACLVSGCDHTDIVGRGWCGMHYQRWRNSGDPLIVTNRTPHGHARRVDGQAAHSEEYGIWLAMKQRCLNPSNSSYKRYGGRGIRVYPEWIDSFEAWYAYIGPRPSPEHSLDRYPDKNGNYEPGNVRWATPKEQQRNMRSNHMLTIDGVTRCVAEWAELSGNRVGTIHTRLTRGYSPRDAVFKVPLLPSQKRQGRNQ